MSRAYITEQRKKSQEQYHKFRETCRNLVKSARPSQQCSQTTVSVTFANIVNSSNDKLPGERIFGPMNINEQCSGSCYDKYNADSCDAVPIFNHRTSTEGAAKFDIPMLNVENDRLNSEALIKRKLKLNCDMFGPDDEDNVLFFDHTDQEVSFLEDIQHEIKFI